MSEIFDGLLDNSINTGIKKNIKDAIESLGVRVPANTCLWEYPDIIRTKLVANALADVKAHDIIKIYTTLEDNKPVYNISTKYDTVSIIRPNYAADNVEWSNEMSVDKVFDDLFNNILPSVKGIHAGDVTLTDYNGKDTKEWVHTLFNVSGTKSDLKPNASYLRLYLTSQSEPVYILLDIDYATEETILKSIQYGRIGDAIAITPEQIENLM